MHISWARLASFCQLGFISDPLVVSKFHNETHDHIGQENKIFTIVKGRETFYRRHTVPITSCSEVNSRVALFHQTNTVRSNAFFSLLAKTLQDASQHFFIKFRTNILQTDIKPNLFVLFFFQGHSCETVNCNGESL